MIIRDKLRPHTTLASSSNASERALWNLSLIMREIAGKELKPSPIQCKENDKKKLEGKRGENKNHQLREVRRERQI